MRRQDVRIVGASEGTPHTSVRNMDGEKGKYGQRMKEAEESGRKQDKRECFRQMFGRLKSIKVVTRKIVTSMLRKQVAKVLARVL